MRNTAENFWIKITVSHLSYELGLHGKKNFNADPKILLKNGHSEDDTFHTTSKTPENLKRVIFIMKVLH